MNYRHHASLFSMEINGIHTTCNQYNNIKVNIIYWMSM